MQVLRLTGTGFGPIPYSSSSQSAVTYGSGSQYAATACAVVVNDTGLVCTSVPGFGTASAVTVAVSGLSFTSPVLGYAPPCLTRVTITGVGAVGGNTVGGDAVVITGHNFGPVGSRVDFAVYGAGVAVGSNPFAASGVLYHAVNCSVHVAHVQVTCATAPGVGAGLVWALSIAGQPAGLCAGAAPSDVTTRYAPPAIVSVSVAASTDAAAGTAATEGGSVVVVVGANFGRAGSSSFVVDGQAVWLVDHVNDTLAVLTLPAGSGVGKRLDVVTGGQRTNGSAASGALLAYAPPVIVGVTVLHGTNVLQKRIEVVGLNLGELCVACSGEPVTPGCGVVACDVGVAQLCTYPALPVVTLTANGSDVAVPCDDVCVEPQSGPSPTSLRCLAS